VIQNELHDRGIDLPLLDILTSGLALAPYFNKYGLKDQKALVMGNHVTIRYVKEAGGIPLPAEDLAKTYREARVVVIGCNPVVDPKSDPRFDPFSPVVINAAVNALRLDRHVRGVVANPDLSSPQDQETIAVAGGAFGYMIAKCSRRILDNIGKPYRPIYELAFAQLPGIPKEEIIMVGDSLAYDIKGASNVGIKSLLVLSGNTTMADLKRSRLKPDFIAASFVPEAPLLEIP